MKNIVLLQGWTQTKDKLFPLKKELKKKGFKVFLPTLPGFGGEKLKKTWNLDDYINWLNKFLTKNKIKKTVLVGHSFGGQIAAKFSLLYFNKVSCLILIAAAVIRWKASLPRRVLILISQKLSPLFKIFPFDIFYDELKFLVYKSIGENDYYRAGPILQKTMKQIISENLENDLDKISMPTLIIWGEKDKTTSVKKAHLIARKIIHSKLVIFKDASHRLPYNQPREVVEEICKFIQTQN